MKNIPLLVAQYNLIGHPSRTEHWALVALKSRYDAYIFELVGNRDTYGYSPKKVDHYATSDALRGGCLVGSVIEDKLEWLKEALRGVEIIRNTEDFDCQTWVINAIRFIQYEQEDGVYITQSIERAIRNELKLEKERWDVADDTLEERLYPD